MKVGDKIVWLDPAHETSHVTEIIKQINKPKNDRFTVYLCSNGTTELEALKNELVTLEETTCHVCCGTIDIQSEAWSYPNYIEGQNPHKEFVDAGRNYCPNCEIVFEDDELTSVSEYLKNKEEKE
jgi:hypothetical protein